MRLDEHIIKQCAEQSIIYPNLISKISSCQACCNSYSSKLIHKGSINECKGNCYKEFYKGGNLSYR